MSIWAQAKLEDPNVIQVEECIRTNQDIKLASYAAEMFVFVSIATDSTISLPLTSSTNLSHMIISTMSDKYIEDVLKEFGMNPKKSFSRTMSLNVMDFPNINSFVYAITFLKSLYTDRHPHINKLKLEMDNACPPIALQSFLQSLCRPTWKKWTVLEHGEYRYETDMYDDTDHTIIEVKTTYTDRFNVVLKERKKLAFLRKVSGINYVEYLIFMRPLVVLKLT